MKPLVRFALTKIDEDQRLVYGVAAAEEVDKSGEILDYESSKPLIAQWSEEARKATEAAGQETSYGNVRVMHGMTVAGPLRSIEFDDAAKSVSVCAHVVDDATWNMVAAGGYTGFSIGGDYAKRWYDPQAKAVRYTAAPKEMSIVDNPCIGSAHFTVVKADGATETRAFRAMEARMDWESLVKVYARGRLAKDLSSAGDASATLQGIREGMAALVENLSDPSGLQAAIDKFDAAAIKALQAEIAASAEEEAKPADDAEAAEGDAPAEAEAKDAGLEDAAGMKPADPKPDDAKPAADVPAATDNPKIPGKPQPVDGKPKEDSDDADKCTGPTQKAADADGEGELRKLATAARAEAAELKAALQKSVADHAALAEKYEALAARVESLAKTAAPIGRPAENVAKTLGVESLIARGDAFATVSDVNDALDTLRKAGASAETLTKLTIEAAAATCRRG
ncbi:MAG: hypothetical protein ABFD84_11240 [Candidatus Polarisedimenticolia bacterium]|nr:hypothetical protein [bacterium]